MSGLGRAPDWSSSARLGRTYTVTAPRGCDSTPARWRRPWPLMDTGRLHLCERAARLHVCMSLRGRFCG